MQERGCAPSTPVRPRNYPRLIGTDGSAWIVAVEQFEFRIIMAYEANRYRRSLGARSQDSTVTVHRTGIGNRLLAALPPADLGLLTPYFQKVSFEPGDVLVRSGDELDPVYFPHSGAIAFMLDMPDGQTVATTLMGREGALASASVHGPSP